MAKKTLDRILTTQDASQIKARGPGGVLSRLFHQMLIDLNINTGRFGSFMHDYVNDPNNRVPKDRSTQTSRRSNLIKALSDNAMSWKVFCRGLRLLQLRRFEITIKAYHRHGNKVSTHTVGVDLVHPEHQDVFEETENDIPRSESTNALAKPINPLVGEDK